MNLPLMTNNLNNISSLSDQPNKIDGLSSAELKELFDKASNTIKNYVNDELIPAITTGIPEAIAEIPAENFPPTICNNTFENPLTARQNLRIFAVTSIPSNKQVGDIYLVYKA